MSPTKDRAFILGSSPSHDIDRLFDDQNMAETGWTPYIDKIFGTQPTGQTPGKAFAGKNSASSAQLSSQGQPAGSSLAPYRASPTQHRKIRHYGPKIGRKADSSLANAHQIARNFDNTSFGTPKFPEETPFTSHLLSSPQIPGQPSPWTSTFRTPLADKSFRVSDYLFDTPGTLPRPDEAAYASIDPEIRPELDENDKENDPLVMGMLSTPNGSKTYRLFKTPMSAKLAKLNSTKAGRHGANLPVAAIETAQSPSLNISSYTSLARQQRQQQQQQDLQLQQQQPSLYSTPLKAQFKTPSRMHGRDILGTLEANIEPDLDSSPSTILLTSTVKKAEGVKPDGIDASPTPATKSHLSKPPCRLVHSNSAMEPAMGLFEGETRQKQLRRSTTVGVANSSNLPMMATFSSSGNRRSGHKRKAGSAGAGTRKFQIIFADMKSLKASYSSKRDRKSRAKPGSAKKQKTAAPRKVPKTSL